MQRRSDSSPDIESASASERAADGSVSWSRARRDGLIAYLASRLVVLLGVGIVTSTNAAAVAGREARPASAFKGMLDALASWDGAWYLEVVRHGYPRVVPANLPFGGDEATHAARVAFFPLYPSLVRVVDAVLPGGDVGAAVFTNFLLGFLVVLGIGWLAREWFDDDVARRAMILTAIFPGSFVLSFAYSEALLIVLACACLYWLGRKQWELAGLAALLGGLTRPNGLALAVACAVVAVVAIRRDREWRALVAPLLAPLGFIGFQLFLGHQTGESGVWFRAQREAWHEGYSYGWSTLERIGRTFTRPLHSPTDLFCTLTVAATVVLIVVARRERMPIAAWAYTWAVVVLMILPETVTARPRFLMTAFPLIVALAAWWPRRRLELWGYTVAACAVGLMALTLVYGGQSAVP